MDLVRKIQSSFYSTDTNIDDDDDDDGGETQRRWRWLQKDDADPTLLHRVPLWRVPWTELPGYQNVLNVHVPHYTHMFRTLLLQHPGPPWYFGHVYLHGGSDNLGNPDYHLPQRNGENGTLVVQDASYAPTIGTLMQITDYDTLDDGRLSLIVQGLSRMQIVEATQQVPYAVAGTIRLLPDDELWKPTVRALTSALALDEIHDKDSIRAITEACRSVACHQEEALRRLEYRPTILDKMTTKEEASLEVSALSNVDGSATVDFPTLQNDLNTVFRQRLSYIANDVGSDEVLLATSTVRLPPAVNAHDADDRTGAEAAVAEWEQKVWIELDRMIQLLETIQPNLTIPVPAQMLGLIPTDVVWPSTFRLERYANALEAEGANVGTYSKSPFVRLSKQYPDYPALRRASRFSYVVWTLLYTVSFDNQTLDKEEVLQTRSVRERLRQAHQQLQRLNNALLSMYEG